MQNLEAQTLSSIVLEHHEYVPVLEKYSLDFCCRGKRTLSEACAEKNLSAAKIIAEMNAVENNTATQLPFEKMTAAELISYILIRHHFYVKNSMPVIINHLNKLVEKHGQRYLHMPRVLELFTTVKNEMESHMAKEEMVLFPRIKEMAGADNPSLHYKPEYIAAPIDAMEAEHENAGDILFEIRDLTDNYTPPADACTTHKVCLQELKTFEEDLHQHVHLENNILFPMALAMVQGKE